MNKKEIENVLKILKSQKLITSYSILIEKMIDPNSKGYSKKYRNYLIKFIDYHDNPLYFSISNVYKINLKEIFYKMILNQKY